MDPSPWPPQTGVAYKAPTTPGIQQSQAPALGVLSGARVTTEHIRWVTGLRAARGRWSSEVQGPWTETENAYFEFVYELFRSGLLGGVDAGLPLRFFLSELLGCEVDRVDQKLLNARRSPDFAYPRGPSRKLGAYEHQVITSKLLLLEQAFLAREQNPLEDRVVFEGGEKGRTKGATRMADARAAYVDPRMSSSVSIAAVVRGTVPGATAGAMPGTVLGAGVAASGGVPQANGQYSGVVGAAAAACAAAAAESNGVSTANQSAPPAPAAVSAGQSTPAVPAARGLLAAALAGPETVSRRPAAVAARSPAVAAAAAAAAAAAPAGRRSAAAPAPAIGHRHGSSVGRELGQKLLGTTRDAATINSGTEGLPRQKQKTCTITHYLSPTSSTAAAAGSVPHARSRAAESWDGEVQETPEDVAAMEYLKWELHGKFMAFPGEHYQNLLASLASEIYHNRYPVEHGVDILHGVMRDAGPEALQKCASTLKRMNLPPKMTL